MFPRFLILCLSICFICSCKRYRFHNKQQHVINTRYEKGDTLLMSGYVLCNTLRNSYKLKKEQEFEEYINLDSIFDIFQSSLTKLNLPIKFSENKNGCDSLFRANWRMKIDETNKNIAKLKTGNKDIVQLIPVVHVTNFYQKHVYVQNGLFGGGHYIKQTILELMIYVIKGEEVLYLRSGTYFGKSYLSYDPKDTRTNLEQEHWDKLVELVMRDYINRLK